MSDRVLWVLVGVFAAAVLAAQAAIKPGIDQSEIRSVAASLGGRNAWIGRPAADFELPLRDGTVFRLSDHVGREVVIVNFWATWCGPCRAEMPELSHFARQMADQGHPVAMLAIDAQEPSDKVDAFVRRQSISIPVAIDDAGVVLSAFGVEAFPTTVVIGADGSIKLYEAGAISNADVALGPTVTAECDALRSPETDPDARREAWRIALGSRGSEARREGFTPPPAAVGALTGRALSIAEAMPCPCGCDRKVVACTCQTAKAVKARLAAGIDDALTDGEVMQRLNREFCMKGR